MKTAQALHEMGQRDAIPEPAGEKTLMHPTPADYRSGSF
jgi:hypothetical protein